MELKDSPAEAEFRYPGPRPQSRETALVMIAVSYLTPAPDYAKIAGLTFGTATEKDRLQTRSSWDWRDVAGSAVVLVCILGAYIYFTG